MNSSSFTRRSFIQTSALAAAAISSVPAAFAADAAPKKREIKKAIMWGTVGVKGSVTGEVLAQTVRMHGAIKGMIRAKSVFLASTARMSGDVEHESLAIEPGAFMEGHCKRITEAAPAPVVEVPRAPERQTIGSQRVGGMPKAAVAAT